MVPVEHDALFAVQIALTVVGGSDVYVGRTGLLLLFVLFKAEEALGEERSILL